MLEMVNETMLHHNRQGHREGSFAGGWFIYANNRAWSLGTVITHILPIFLRNAGLRYMTYAIPPPRAIIPHCVPQIVKYSMVGK